MNFMMNDLNYYDAGSTVKYYDYDLKNKRPEVKVKGPFLAE